VPVILEDEVMVAGNAGVYEGTVVKAAGGAQVRDILESLDAGVRPVCASWCTRAKEDEPLVIPEEAIVVPVRERCRIAAGKSGAFVVCSGDCEVPRRRRRMRGCSWRIC